jgi:glycyl-tRNA synthetase
MPDVSAWLHHDIAQRLRRHRGVEHDVKGTIDKRYARMDEAGCPYCFTVDGQTLQDQTVTVGDRDTGHQERIGIDRVVAYLGDKLGV